MNEPIKWIWVGVKWIKKVTKEDLKKYPLWLVRSNYARESEGYLFEIIRVRDGGFSWNLLDAEFMPITEEGIPAWENWEIEK